MILPTRKLGKEKVMNKDQLLSMSRQENGAYDEREQSIQTKSSAIAKAIGVLFGFIIVFIESVFVDGAPIASLAAFSVCFCMNAFEAWYRFAFFRDKFNLIKGIFYTVFSIAFAVCLMHFLFKVYICC